MADPASAAAIARGCLCPARDVIHRDCPLHQYEYERACEDAEDAEDFADEEIDDHDDDE